MKKHQFIRVSNINQLRLAQQCLPCNVFFITKYRISGIFRVGLIFAEFATSLKSPKIDTTKNKHYYMSSLRVLEIVKIGLGEKLTHLPSVIFAKISHCKKFPIYSTALLTCDNHSDLKTKTMKTKTNLMINQIM